MSAEFLNTKELLDWLGISKPTLLAWLRLKADPLPGVKIGGHWKFRRRAVMEWWMRRENTPTRTIGLSSRVPSAKDNGELEAWLSAASKVITDKKK
jgi:excisionase family DNA binding protein